MQNEQIVPIVTDRLRLVSMSVEFLRSLIAKEFERAEQTGGFAVPPDCSLPAKIWAKKRLGMIEEDPEQHPWMFRAIVRNQDNKMVGYISFHHKAPDPDLSEYSDFAVELGYTIGPSYRRIGYAKESAIAMMEWAYREHRVRTFILTISPDNVPSVRMADSMNFKKVGEWQDPIDGLEYIMRAEIDEILEAKTAYQDL